MLESERMSWFDRQTYDDHDSEQEGDNEITMATIRPPDKEVLHD
jgi:hypothetical protein